MQIDNHLKTTKTGNAAQLLSKSFSPVVNRKLCYCFPMDLTWLGTAGFIIKGQQGIIAFDPFISRGTGAKSPFTAKSFADVEAMFIGHGHFDHTYDVPEIALNTEAKVFAPGLTGLMLKLRGLPSDRLVHASNEEMLLKKFNLRAYKSSHAKFDLPLVYSTLKRCKLGDCAKLCGLGFGYPKGMVQTYSFEIKNKKILFISSAGCTEKELLMYRNLEIDYLLAPLQGHTHIQEIVAKQTMIINPKVVIPHHHDDFYPPISQSISVEVFKDKLKHLGFKGNVLEIPLFHSCDI
ncbi:hypothetical protein CIK05_01060 [Bdellovibrio sp. qaytius]|nr:hypothetical protein CIK05_01060 [Bdellovibrio sp. qaytius]